MKDVHSSDFVAQLLKYLMQVGEEPLGILRQNTRVAVLMSVEEFDRYQDLKQAFIKAASDGSDFACRWVELEKASRLQFELVKK